MIGALFKELIGLFVDDEFLALAILAAVAVFALLKFSDIVSETLSGLVLVIALPLVLVVGVLRTLRRGRWRSAADGPPSGGAR
jgi:hypothetical protein